GNLAHCAGQLASDDPRDDVNDDHNGDFLSDHGLYADLWQQRASSHRQFQHAGDAAAGNLELLFFASDGRLVGSNRPAAPVAVVFHDRAAHALSDAGVVGQCTILCAAAGGGPVVVDDFRQL